MLNLTVMAAAANNIFSRVFADQGDAAVLAPSTGQILICVGGGLGIGIIVALVYMFTHRKTGYSQSMVITLPMLSMLVSGVMIMMCLLSAQTATAAAISLTGAFSLVRFRSAPGDPRDIAFIFFSMTLGVICGVGYVGYAYAFLAILSAVLLVLHFISFGAPKTQDMTLKITIPENLNYNGLFDKVFEKYTTSYLLRRVKTTDFGTLFDLVYSIQIKQDADQKKFIDELRTLNGNLNVTLVLYRYDDQIYDTKTK